MTARLPTMTEQEQLAELPFLVVATVLARDTELTDEEIAAAQAGLNTLDMPELIAAIAAVDHSPTELFELAWLDESPERSLSDRRPMLSSLFGSARGIALCGALVDLGRMVAASSHRPLRGDVLGAARGLRRVEAALAVQPATSAVSVTAVRSGR